MQFKGIQLVIAIIFLGFVACNKKTTKNPEPDIFAPVISITTPSQGSAQNALYPVNFVGTITDLLLDSAEVFAYIPDSNNRVLLHKFPDVKGKNGYIFNEKFTLPTVGAPINCIGVVNAKDQSGNFSTDSVNFIIFKI